MSKEFLSPISVLASATFDQSLYLTGDNTPSSITTDQNNYSPSGLASTTILRLQSTTTVNITGLQGGTDGRIIVVCNVGSNDIIFKNSSALSTDINRFLFDDDITVLANQSFILLYDSSANRWRNISKPSGSAVSSSSTIALNVFSGNNSQTVFTLGQTVSDENLTFVFISGVYQAKSEYSVSGTTITFTSAPPTGTNNIEVLVPSINTSERQNVFIQTNQPTVSYPYLWIDTSGGDVQMWIEDGL